MICRQRKVDIIGAALGHGAPDPRCAEAPAVLRAAGLESQLHAAGVSATWRATVQPSAANSHLPLTAVAQVAGDIARIVGDSISRDCLPLIVGGDHSCAIGTWKGIAHALSGSLGLIWIDAHMDAHTFETSESGRLHGMPLACLLGYGDPALTGIAKGARLEPQHVCLIGVRSYEKGEAALLERLGVRIYTMREIRQRGLDVVVQEAREIVSAGTVRYGISFDLDAIDPGEAPGVGSAVRGGFAAADIITALNRYASDPALRGLEIVEYNPHLDHDAQTMALIPAIAIALLSPQIALQNAAIRNSSADQ